LNLLSDLIVLTVQIYIASTTKEKKTTRCYEFGLILLLSLVPCTQFDEIKKRSSFLVALQVPFNHFSFF
jgi:hypothetical protein